jgi:hypothetical protein
MLTMRLNAIARGPKSPLAIAATADHPLDRVATSRTSVESTASISSPRSRAFEQVAEPLHQKRAQLGQHLVALPRQIAAVERECVGAGDREVEPPLLLDQDLHDPERGAPESVGILRARWDETQPEQPRERVEPVGERDDAAHVAPRNQSRRRQWS